MIEHVHSCPQCRDDVLCSLDCDDMADGDNVCGPCAERNFDAIKPQEASTMEKDCYALCDFGWDGSTLYGPYTEAEARRRYPNAQDLLLRLVRGPYEPLYPSDEEPEA